MKTESQLFKSIKRIKLKTQRSVQSVLAGAYHSAFKGKGMEFEEVREYQPGDEIRSIDWNVTARMQYPFVKNYREERELSVMLLVDVSASSLFGTTGQKKAELIAEIGAAIGFSAISNQDKVGLILFSDHVELYLPPKKGLKHALRLIRELLVFQPKGTKTDISKALEFLVQVQKKKNVIFLLSDFFSPSFKEPLSLVGKKHDVIGLMVNDRHEKSLPNVGLIQFRDLETQQIKTIDTSSRKLRQQLQDKAKTRSESLQKLFNTHAGGLMEIEPSQSYVEVIRKFFEQRKGVS